VRRQDPFAGDGRNNLDMAARIQDWLIRQISA
jgi:hypothetical protein